MPRTPSISGTSGGLSRRAALAGSGAGVAALFGAPGAVAAAGTPTLIAGAPVSRLMQVGSRLFWTYTIIDRSGPTASRSGVMRMNKSGSLGSARKLFEIRHTARVEFGRIAYGVAGTESAFFVVNTDFHGALQRSEIWRCSLNGGSPVKLCQAPEHIGDRDIFVSGGYVFWSDASGVCRVATSGGAPTRIVTKPNITDVAVDRYDIYYAIGTTLFYRGLTSPHTFTMEPTESPITSVSSIPWGDTMHQAWCQANGTVEAYIAGVEFSLITIPGGPGIITRDAIASGGTPRRLVFAYKEGSAPWLLRLWRDGTVATLPGTGSLNPYRSLLIDSSRVFYALGSGVYRITL